MLEDLMKIYEAIELGHGEAMINWSRCEDFKIQVSIKLGVCVEFEFHMKNTKLKDWCS